MIVERKLHSSVGLYNLFEHCSIYMSSNTWKFDANLLHLTISIQKSVFKLCLLKSDMVSSARGNVVKPLF